MIINSSKSLLSAAEGVCEIPEVSCSLLLSTANFSRLTSLAASGHRDRSEINLKF